MLWPLIVFQIHLTCPHLSVLTMVCEDAFLENYAVLRGLRSVTVELEDCFGMGLYNFLLKMGPQLQELGISCSSGQET